MKNSSKHTCRLLCLLSLLSAFAPVAIAQAPTSGWSNTGCLNEARRDHTATLLLNGKVLVVGGGKGEPYQWSSSAELYDPATGTWSYTGSPSTPRRGHIAMLLTNGKVLVAGGLYGMNQVLTSAELYDPATGAWSATGNLNSFQFQPSATRLANGKVLVVGTWEAQIYDPTSGTWSTVSDPDAVRHGHTATLLGNNKVLVIGVGSEIGSPIAELYDPDTGKWSGAGTLKTLYDWPSPPILLPNGKVLVTGEDVTGFGQGAEIYDPTSGTWSSTGAPSSNGLHAVLLASGKVLVASGVSADLYEPAIGRWSGTPNLNPARNFSTATLLSNGNVLFTWESSCGPGSNNAARFDYRSAPSSAVASVSAASYSTLGLASGAIAAAFGAGLATTTSAAIAVPLPTQLAGTTVKVTDSAGMERPAPLFFVSPNQVNYQIPPGTATGAATVTITSGDGMVSNGVAIIQPVAPGLFTANADGQGVAAAVALRVKADGSQSYEPIAEFDAALNKFVARPLDLGPEGEQVYLVLFGTGIRPSVAVVRCLIRVKGIAAVFLSVTFAGAQGAFVGLDQVNTRLSRDLIGRGEVEVVLNTNNLFSNQVRINIK